jgi:SAM-dependent methyltransferase
MFLSRRATQAEYSDAPGRSAGQIAVDYRQLARVNRLFLVTDPFQRLLVRWLGRDRCRSLSILDLGAGDGSVGRAITRWAAQQGWEWRVTNLDANPLALQLNPGGHNVIGSVLALPFADDSFDAVIASQMTHHLANDEEVMQHFREAWRVTRDALFLTDLHRNPVLLGLVWLITRCAGLSPEMRADGAMSVRRGWRIKEWQALANAAGIPRARVWLYYGSRIMLQARKSTKHQPADDH